MTPSETSVNTDSDESAFPYHYDIGGPYPNYRSGSGMSLRDYFAAHAPLDPVMFDGVDPMLAAQTRAKLAYIYADAMIAERAK